MRAVDTNVLVRSLFDDDSEQAGLARSFVTSNSIYVPITVMLESAWILKSAYGLNRASIVRVLRQFAGLPAVTVENADDVERAFDLADEGFDIADALHLVRSEACLDLVTFDRDFAQVARRVGEWPVALLENSYR